MVPDHRRRTDLQCDGDGACGNVLDAVWDGFAPSMSVPHDAPCSGSAPLWDLPLCEHVECFGMDSGSISSMTVPEELLSKKYVIRGGAVRSAGVVVRTHDRVHLLDERYHPLHANVACCLCEERARFITVAALCPSFGR